MVRVAPRPLSTDNVHGPVRVAVTGAVREVAGEVGSVAMDPRLRRPTQVPDGVIVFVGVRGTTAGVGGLGAQTNEIVQRRCLESKASQDKAKNPPNNFGGFYFCSSNWARTSDPSINSRMLCQLSYGGILLSFGQW